MPTVLNGGGKGGGHAGLVAAFLQKYYGSDGQNQGLDRPLDTATVKARFGLVTVEIGGEPWALVDIGMRMLEPRELARAQGFPDSFILEGTKADQIARIGNSVCPPVAEALVRANVGVK
jgi:DNA (cytosine-5)-methyltransferase 1